MIIQKQKSSVEKCKGRVFVVNKGLTSEDLKASTTNELDPISLLKRFNRGTTNRRNHCLLYDAFHFFNPIVVAVIKWIW